MQSFLLLLPDFALIALGVVLRHYAGLEEGFWQGVEKLVYFVLFPALLFNALARAQIDLHTFAPLFAVGLLTMGSGLVLGLLGRPLMGLGAMAFASRLQCAYRFNTYIGIAVAGKFGGAAGVAAMGALCGAMVPFANMAAVGFLAHHGQGRLGRELVRNPLIIATLAGMAFTRAGVGYVHALSHQIGAIYHLPHGLVNSIVMPRVLSYYRPECAPRMAALARAAGLATSGQSDAELADALIEWVHAMNAQMGMPQHIQAIQSADFDRIVDNAFAEAHGTYGVPRYLDRGSARTLLQALAPQ